MTGTTKVGQEAMMMARKLDLGMVKVKFLTR
jgi:hypothetical protein